MTDALNRGSAQVITGNGREPVTTNANVMRARIIKSTEVIETTLPGELILLDPTSGEMYSLNPTGQLVWERLDEVSPDRIAAQLSESFGIAPSRAEADVRALVADLVRAGLVEADRRSGA